MPYRPDDNGDYRCPICKHKLVLKADGYVCKNYECVMYWKLGNGWVLKEKQIKIFNQ